MSRSRKSKIEQIKEESQGLRGTISDELRESTDHFRKENVQVLKFHGIYQQDDRDLRIERRKSGEDKAHEFMIRIKNPGGGRLSPEQWTVLDDIADQFANGTLRITTRQSIQFHGLGKSNLKNTIRHLDSRLISTFGACGDGNRNTLACPVSRIRKNSVFDGQGWATQIAEHLSFKTLSYYDIWLDGEKVTSARDEKETIYGKAYLPRKFKIAIADPFDNCVDFLTNDVGILPCLERNSLQGFNVFVGGGMGSTHTKKETYPRLGEPLAFVSPDQLVSLVEAVVKTQRDLGNRKDRRQARLKYLVDQAGIASFRVKVADRYDGTLEPPREYTLSPGEHHFGWHKQKQTGMNYVGLFVENGRIQDRPGYRLKTGLRALVDLFQPSIYLTPNQDLIVADIHDQQLEAAKELMDRFSINQNSWTSALRSSSMACPALPTCGLAITEAERRLPGLISELEEEGLGDESIIIRMSGCPNSCSRPPVAEIGLVGKSVNGYNIYLGGNRSGTRLAELFLEDVASEEVSSELGRLIRFFRRNRRDQERFGDFCHRLGIERLRTLRIESIAV